MFRWPERFSSPEEFGQARRQFVEIYQRCLGEMPEPVDLAPKVLESEQRDGYRRELAQYHVEKDEPPVKAYVLIPDGVQFPAPAVVCLHQHGGQFALGKSEQVGRIGSEHQHLALDLARRGYVTITADSRCFEERRKYWDGDGIYSDSLLIRGATLAGRFVWDIQREIDYLLSRPEVDSDRVGIIGHSMGAMQTILLLPLERRIKVAVASQGSKLWAKMIERGDTFPRAFVIPGLHKYADLDALHACFAPRPLLLTGRNEDKVSHIEDQRIVEQRVRAVYELLGAADKFKYVREPGGHLFSPTLREAAYAWLDEHLKG